MGHHHGHGHHGHGHHGHGHHHSLDHNNLKPLRLAAILTGLFMIAELIGGWISGSLALLADAGHMFTDFAALVMAWGAFSLAQRPANWKLTFGYDRLSILVAFVNGLTLVAISIWIIIEAIKRFGHPHEVLTGPMFYVALGGLIVNLLVLFILRSAHQDNLNVRGAVLHVMGDLLGSVGAIAAAIIIWLTGWTPIDPLLSLLIACLILRSAWPLIKESAHILLEGAPHHIDRRAIREDLLGHIPSLMELRHIHAWCITQDRPIITLEAIITSDADPVHINQTIKARLRSHFNIDHSTVDVMPKDQIGEINPKAPSCLHSDE